MKAPLWHPEMSIFALRNLAVHDAEFLDRLSAFGFEQLVGHLLASKGYRLDGPSLSSRAGAGADLYVHLEDSLDLAVPVLVACKHYRGGRLVGVETVRELHDLAMSESRPVAFAMVVTSSRFTKNAQDFARDSARLRLVDRSQLLRWVLEALSQQDHAAESLAYRMSRLSTDHEFGRILLPPDLQVPSEERLAPLLSIPSFYTQQLIAVDQVPLTVLRQIASDPRAMYALSPRKFEEFVAELVEKLGFENVLLTPQSNDGGRDVIASKRVHGIPISFFMECKKYAEDNAVQVETLRALLGVVAYHGSSANIGVLVTTSRFTKGSKELIASECRLDGKDYGGILDWVEEYRKGL